MPEDPPHRKLPPPGHPDREELIVRVATEATERYGDDPKSTRDGLRWFGEQLGMDLWTVNELVAYNMRRARLSRGWSQEQLAVAMRKDSGKQWSNALVSASERSRASGRTRRFDAGDLVTLARVFDLPVDYFFLPPDRAEVGNSELLTMFITGALEDYAGAMFPGTGERALHIPPLLNVAELLNVIEPAEPPTGFVDRVRDAFRRFAGREWRSTADPLPRSVLDAVAASGLSDAMQSTIIEGLTRRRAQLRSQLAQQMEDAVQAMIEASSNMVDVLMDGVAEDDPGRGARWQAANDAIAASMVKVVAQLRVQG